MSKWTEERTEQLKSIVGSEKPVTLATVDTAAEQLEVSSRSIASKLRNLGFEVETVSKSKTFNEEEEKELIKFVKTNQGKYSYSEIAAGVSGGKFSPKEIQGKLLSLEMSSMVKPTPKVAAVKTYTEEEEQKIRDLVGKGAFMEDIAEALGKDIRSIRGKTLSLYSQEGLPIPKQKNKKETTDPLVELISEVELRELTVEEIADRLGKSVRGVKSMLTHRKLVAKNYDGAKRAEKRKTAEAA